MAEIQLDGTKLVLVEWQANRGRNHNSEEEPSICLDCPGEPVYSYECYTAKHRKQTTTTSTVTVAAPDETAAVQGIYNLIQRRMNRIGYKAGGNAYLVADTAALAEVRDFISRLVDEANNEFKVCRINATFTVINLQRDEYYENNLNIFQAKVQSSLREILDALQADKQSPRALHKAAEGLKNAEQLLEGVSKESVGELQRFTARAVGWLKEAEEQGGKVLEKTQKDIRSGAARFQGILAELNGEVQ